MPEKWCFQGTSCEANSVPWKSSPRPNCPLTGLAPGASRKRHDNAAQTSAFTSSGQTDSTRPRNRHYASSLCRRVRVSEHRPITPAPRLPAPGAHRSSASAPRSSGTFMPRAVRPPKLPPCGNSTSPTSSAAGLWCRSAANCLGRRATRRPPTDGGHSPCGISAFSPSTERDVLSSWARLGNGRDVRGL
jgi:hypothetical protein